MAAVPSFERAEFGTAQAAACGRCRQPLTERFFRLDDQPLCEACANAAVLAPAAGAGSALVQAVGYGVVAAVLGCILYAVVEIATGWTIGYVALAVGWMVGKAMKSGSKGRGGRRYQIAAALLTYISVSCASVIVILHALKLEPGEQVGMSRTGLLYLLRYGLLSPFLELKESAFGGAIGLFILFIGIRTAWGLTAGSDFRISGPHDAAELR